MRFFNKLKKLYKDKIYGECKDLGDMPYIENWTLENRQRLSIIYPLYVENKDSINNVFQMLKAYEKMDSELKSLLDIIIVDDGSPVNIDWPKFELNLSVLHILENIKWNSGGAKNLGVCYSATKRVIISDIDHFFPEDTLSWCMSVKETEYIYCFNQLEIQNGGGIFDLHHPHPNIFFLTKKNYFDLHGYDEDFCGYYGDDIFFRKYLLKNFKNKVFIAPKNSYIKEFKEAFKLKRKVNCKRILFFKQYKHSLDFLRFNWKLILSTSFMN